ncbi:MAG: hypothetical protein M3Q75_04045 [Gemmatimonadota bacterium]|nr:hypothetical protein [Gemmatimonadota bacterium]
MTIWERMAECVAALPEPFGRQDVLRWFTIHHPEVNTVSVSTHLQFATSNASPESRGAFSNRTPLVTRVGRGEYVRFRASGDEPFPAVVVVEPVHTPPADQLVTIPESVDIALVGCGRTKRSAPSPAADLYTSSGFRKRRAVAEDAAESWYILSADHGLVAPDEWIAPYDVALDSTDSDYRSAWGRWAVTRLVHKAGLLRGRAVMVLAPAPYADAIQPHLRAAGADVHEPLSGLRQGEQGAWLTAEVERRGITLAPRVPESSSPSPVAGVPTRQAVAEALLTFRQSNEKLHASRLGYAETAEADELLKADPFAFLLGVLLDEGIPAERAWEGPYKLKTRLGHLDPWLVRHQREEVRAAVAERPTIHRYVEIMADAIVRAAELVCSKYNGDASRLWAPGSMADEVDRRFRAFHKIGVKRQRWL